MRHPLTLRVLAVLGVASLLAAGCAPRPTEEPAGAAPPGLRPAGLPDNARLLAAMPPSIESVLIYRDTEPAREGTLCHQLATIWGPEVVMPGEGDEPGGEESLADAVQRTAQRSDAAIVVLAGSGFTRPNDIGLGNYDERAIWVVRKSLAPLERRLRADERIKGELRQFEVAGVTVYQGRRRHEMYNEDAALEDIFAAVVDDRTAVLAERREDIVHMVAQLRGGLGQTPERWARAAGNLPLEAPVVILRAYDRTNALDAVSPVNPNAEEGYRAEIESLALVVPSRNENLAKIRVVTPDAMKAKAVYEAYLIPTDRAEWDVRPIPGGFEGELRSIQVGTQSEGALMLYQLFGPNFAI